MIQIPSTNLLSTGFLKISLFSPTYSPRSLEACRRQGIHPRELLIRNLAEIKEMFKDKHLDKEGLELMAKHYEEKRKEKIRVLLEV